MTPWRRRTAPLPAGLRTGSWPTDWPMSSPSSTTSPRRVREAAEEIADDPQRLEAVRARRQLLRDLCRKYGDTLAEVQRFHREVAERVDTLERYEERAATIDRDRRAADGRRR